MKTEKQMVQIPRFSIQSGLLLLLASIVGGIVLPYLTYQLGLDMKIGVMIFLPASIAFVLSYSHYFIETKKGFCKRFIIMFSIALLILEALAYVWLFMGVIF